MMLQDVFTEDLRRIVSTEHALSKSTLVRTRGCLQLVVLASLTTSGTTPSTNVTCGLWCQTVFHEFLTYRLQNREIHHVFMKSARLLPTVLTRPTHLTWFFFGICLASFFSEQIPFNTLHHVVLTRLEIVEHELFVFHFIRRCVSLIT